MQSGRAPKGADGDVCGPSPAPTLGHHTSFELNHLVSAPNHGTPIAKTRTEPHSRLGAPGPDRCLDSAPTRSDRPADPSVQARAGPRARRRSRRHRGRGVDFDDEIDLRAEDDALIAAELEAAEAGRADDDEEENGDEDEDDESKQRSRRRRGRRGGRRSTRRKSTPLEATFDHGEEGYGLWLDPAVQDDPIYAEYWAGHRPVEVAIEEDQIVIRRVGDDADDDTNGSGNGDGD